MTTMDREPVGGVEGEAVAVSGAAAFGDSARQVGGAAEAEARGTERPLAMSSALPVWSAWPSFKQTTRRM